MLLNAVLLNPKQRSCVAAGRIELGGDIYTPLIEKISGYDIMSSILWSRLMHFAVLELTLRLNLRFEWQRRKHQ